MKHFLIAPLCRAGLLATLFLFSILVQPGRAYPVGSVTFNTDAPFAGYYGASPLTATNTESLLTVAGWADANATVTANLFQYYDFLGINSGTPPAENGALIDFDESMTLQFDNSAGPCLIRFNYTGGDGGTGNGNLARISISGFASDPGASSYPESTTNRITNISYASGTLSFDYFSSPAENLYVTYNQLLFANPTAAAGRTLKITGAASPNGNATAWHAALNRVHLQEGFGGPQVITAAIPQNSTTTYVTPDQLLTIRGYANSNAVTPANLGIYSDDCFGLAPGATVTSGNAVTLQFASSVGLSRLDSIYSGGTVILSGFVSNPGLVDPSSGATSSSFSSGTLRITLADGGRHAFYFTNRAASAGQTIRINEDTSQFGIGGISYAGVHTLLGPDIPSNVSPSYSTPDGLVTLTGYADTPGTVPANLYENVNWFGVSGGANTESIDGAESLNVQFAATAGLSGIGTRYTSGTIFISGFLSDPGFSDPSGTATGVSYSSGTLSYTFNAPHSPEIVVTFTNLSASIGQTLSLHTDGLGGSQLTLTRINYSVAAPVAVSIQKIGGGVVLSWPGGTLQRSTNVLGPYTDVTGATSPYTNAITGSREFFRVRVQ
jgi:hypothetical protein